MKRLAMLLVLILAVGCTTALADERIEIRFSNWDGGDTLVAYNEIADAYNASQDKYKVTILNIPEEYSTKVSAMVAAGDTPEFAMLDANEILYPLAESGHIVNMLDLITADPEYNSDEMLDTLKAWYGNDFMVGYAAGAQDVITFYNPYLFDKYEVEYPPANWAEAWDWDTFLDNAKTLTVDANGNNAHSPDFDPENISTYGVSFSRWWAVWMPFVKSNGGDFLNAEGTQFAMNSPEAAEAMQRLSDLINVHHVAPTPAATDQMGTSEALAANKVAMVFDGQWTNCTLMADEIEYDVAALPRMGDQAKTVVTYGVLCVMNTPEQEGAWDFFKFISATGAASPLERDGLWLSTTKTGFGQEYFASIATDVHPASFYDAVCVPMLDGTADPMPTTHVRNFKQIYDIFNPALDNMWFGNTSYEEAIASVYDACNALVAGWNYND